MKKVISILASILCISTAWAYEDVNNYASDLQFPNDSTMNQNHTINVKFLVQAPTKGVWVYLDKENNGSFETEIFSDPNLVINVSNKEDLTYGNVTCTIPNDIAPGRYRWAVKVKGSQDHSGWTIPREARNKEWRRYIFREAMGVAVDCSYESAHLGWSYVTESQGGTTDAINLSSSYPNYTRSRTDGIYVFDSYMGQKNDGNSYSGGISWCTESKNYEQGPFRVCTDDEGYVYVCENRPTADYPEDILVRRMHPRKLNEGMQTVLTQGHVPSDIAGRIHSIAVTKKTNGDTVMYAILGGTSNGVLTENSGRLCEFKMTDNGSSIRISHQRTVNLKNEGLISIFTTIVPGKNDDVWIFQHRGSSEGNLPSGIHLNSEWSLADEDIYFIQSKNRLNLRGAGAVTRDGTIVAIPTQIDNYTKIRFYRINYDGTDKSCVKSLTNLEMDLQVPRMKAGGTSNEFTGNEFVEGMAFDVANNLYFVSGNQANGGKSVDRLYVYALPKADNSHTTPARSALPIIVPGEEVIWHPYPKKPDNYATDADYAAWIKTKYSTAITKGYEPYTPTRDGYILAGWYYGDETTYDINCPYDKSTPESGHLWARWIKATFEEGYITASVPSDSYSKQEVKAGRANRNMELASLLQDHSYLPSNPIKVNRKLQGGMYNTFMLPFTLTQDLRKNIKDSKEQALADDAILTLQSVTSHTTNGETLYELEFEPVSASEVVPAYQPFLIKPTNDLTATMTFPNVSAVEELPTQPAEVDGVSFVPVFEPTTIGGEESNILILVANNRLAKLSGEGEMLGLRGYFDVGDTFSSASYVMKIVDKAGVVTYVGDATAPQKGSVATKILHNGQIYILRGDEVYTITGYRVQ